MITRELYYHHQTSNGNQFRMMCLKAVEQNLEKTILKPDNLHVLKYVVFYKNINEQLFTNCKKKIPTLVQFSSYLLNKILHKENCTKVGIPTFAVNKILLSNNISEQKHVIAM